VAYAEELHENLGPAPAGYPDPVEPQAIDGPRLPTYEERRAWLLECKADRPAPPVLKGYYHELARLEINRGPIHEELIRSVLSYIDARQDCADFLMLGITRILLQYSDSPLLTADLRGACLTTVLNFKYHPSERGIDSMCTWTENHAIMFATCDYLHSCAFPDRIFTNTGEAGRARIGRARLRITRWLCMRFQTGFSEWLSHVYFDEDIMALLNLIDFAPEEDIAAAARAVLDLVCVELASGSFHGALATSHGRSYSIEKRHPQLESIADTIYLLFGQGGITERDNMSAIGLALSDYRCPETIRAVADDHELTTRQTCGILVRDALRWGVKTSRDEGIFEMLTLEAYAHPLTIRHFVRLLSHYRWWQNDFFKPFVRYRNLLQVLSVTRLAGLLAFFARHDVSRNTRERAEVMTTRTPDYQVSCAVDWRPGYGGDQQHIWQAALGRRAVVFTTHPGSLGEGSVSYWTGSGILPRAVSIGRTVVVLYRLHERAGLYHTNRLMFTHAWFPVSEFDEVLARGHWVFARLGDGYLGLRCPAPPQWFHFHDAEDPSTGPGTDEEIDRSAPATLDDDLSPNEIRCEGRQAVWICEVGSRAEDGEFSSFCSRLESAAVTVRIGAAGPRVHFASPSAGTVLLGWHGRIRVTPVDGRTETLRPTLLPVRIANSHVHMLSGETVCKIWNGEQSYEMQLPDSVLP